MDFDLNLFLLINQIPHNPALNFLMRLTSDLVSVLILIFFLVLLYEAFVSLKDFREVFFLFLSLTFGFIILVELPKNLVARPRPAQSFSAVVVVDNLTSGFSFPSAHSFLIAFLSVLLARKKDRLLVLFLPFSFLVGFSRIFLGVHYPSDVFVGLGLGFLWGLFINLVIDRFIEHRIFKILKFHVEQFSPP